MFRSRAVVKQPVSDERHEIEKLRTRQVDWVAQLAIEAREDRFDRTETTGEIGRDVKTTAHRNLFQLRLP
jgi:hypothetical protein